MKLKMKNLTLKSILVLFSLIFSGIIYAQDSTQTLMDAVNTNDLDKVKELVEKGADVNDIVNGQYIIMYAVQNSNIDIVTYLVEKGANVNVKDSDGETLLMYAVRNLDLATVKFLVEKAADVNESGNYGQTVLMIQPFKYGQKGNWDLEIFKYLVESGAKISAVDSNGATVLMHAISNGSLDVIKYLVEGSVDVNEHDKNGQTALMYAALVGDRAIIDYLTARGADLDAKDYNGNDVLNFMVRNTDAAQYLMENGFDIGIRWVTNQAGLAFVEDPLMTKTMDTVLLGEQVSVLYDDGGWCKVARYGIIGWLLREGLSKFNPNSISNDLIGTWGDTDPAIPGPGSEVIMLNENGTCTINQTAGGFEGNWKYNPAENKLILEVMYTDENGKISEKPDILEYEIMKMTDSILQLKELNKNDYLVTFWRQK
jgi:ankyrin repeat protein